MKFCIITHVEHFIDDESFFAYAPYINEMNIWIKFVDQVVIVAPITKFKKNNIFESYKHHSIDFYALKSFNAIGFLSKLNSIFIVPKNCLKIYKAMKNADHIHLRCPGNIGLLACFIQIFFPSKLKTAKYAGNWDPNAIQPLSYKLQKWILSNTFLTRNMQVLVYGEWENQSKNIKSFYTATYSESDKIFIALKNFDNRIKFVFVGTLTTGKRPLYAIQLIHNLCKLNPNIQMQVFGEGAEHQTLIDYIDEHQLGLFVQLMGNQKQDVIKNAYIDSHFVILPSKSEGWPKAIAEGMFWGCLPIATSISCIANMLDNNNRGLLLTLDIDTDVENINFLLKQKLFYDQKVLNAMQWSRIYTKDFFEREIFKLLDIK